ncbi:MAG: pilin [Patescibacteria group bacterium]|jgi:hypothetical protein
MKKIIFLISLFVIFFPVVIFAKEAGDTCTKADQSADGCPYNKSKYSEGLECNIASDYQGKPINKCVNLKKESIPVGGYCLKDEQCEKEYSAYSYMCNKATWTCIQKATQKVGQPCSEDGNCFNSYCDKTGNFGTCKNVEKGTCLSDEDCWSQQLGTGYHSTKPSCDTKIRKCYYPSSKNYTEACISSGECLKGYECFVLPEKTEGQCLYPKNSRKAENKQNCTITSECETGAYCHDNYCDWQAANTSTCTQDIQCSNGYCADANGVAVTGGASGTCVTGVAEGGACSTDPSSTKKCSSGFICTGVNEQTKEGKCAKSTVETTESLDQIAAQEKAKSNLSSQINLYCDVEATPGMFTKGVSNTCFNCGNCGSRDIMVIVTNVINGTLQITGLFAAFASIVSGFMYIISRGNDEQVGKAKGALTASITGLIIVFTGYILINTVMTVLGYNCGQWFNPTFTC